MLAMHKPPSKSAIKSALFVRKKFSFATFHQYDICKGYRYPASQSCVDTILDARYNLPPREQVTIHPPLVANLQWMVVSPSITFGTISLPVVATSAISAPASRRVLHATPVGGLGVNSSSLDNAMCVVGSTHDSSPSRSVIDLKSRSGPWASLLGCSPSSLSDDLEIS